MINHMFVVAICAHENTPQLSSMLGNWRRSLGRDRVYLLFDASKTKPPRDPHLLQFTNEECAAANEFHASNWENVEYKISLLSRAFEETDADFVWMIESDVGCDGDIATCLDRASFSKADFMAFDVRRYGTSNSDWAWWNSLKGDIATRVPMKDRVGCFFPVTRYSRSMVDAVIRNMGKSSGFCEAYIPTLAVAEGLVVEKLPSSMEGDVGFAIYEKLPGKGNHALYHKYVVAKGRRRLPWELLLLLLIIIVIIIIAR